MIDPGFNSALSSLRFFGMSAGEQAAVVEQQRGAPNYIGRTDCNVVFAIATAATGSEHVTRSCSDPVREVLRIDPVKIGNKIVNGPGGKRIIDIFITVGQRTATIEAKYGIPRHGSQAFLRLVAQLRSAMAAQDTGQVVLWTFRAPTQAELTGLLAKLGSEGSAIQLVHGLQGLASWARFFFSPI